MSLWKLKVEFENNKLDFSKYVENSKKLEYFN